MREPIPQVSVVLHLRGGSQFLGVGPSLGLFQPRHDLFLGMASPGYSPPSCRPMTAQSSLLANGVVFEGKVNLVKHLNRNHITRSGRLTS